MQALLAAVMIAATLFVKHAPPYQVDITQAVAGQPFEVLYVAKVPTVVLTYAFIMDVGTGKVDTLYFENIYVPGIRTGPIIPPHRINDTVGVLIWDIWTFELLDYETAIVQ